MFHVPDAENVQFLDGDYSIPLVILSILIAFGASHTALFINKQLRSNGFFHRYVWLILASLAMGLGIWSMHFIGMTAFTLPIEMEHNIFLTIISALPAILASFIAFALANGKKQKLSLTIVASIFMGAGISTMHYLGMSAMKGDASYVYDPLLFAVSIIIAIVTSFAALTIFTFGNRITDNVFVKLAAASLMACAISSMHYTGMYAIKFYVSEDYSVHSHVHANTANFTPTVIIIAIGITILFLIAFLTSKLDHYVNFRIKNFDPLTSLPNQNQFMDDQMNQRVTTFVAIIHLHNFERFISAYGYTYGDDIIVYIQKLIVKMMPEECKLYRTEANRFTVVMPMGAEVKLYRQSLLQLCAVLSKPVFIGERMVTVEMGCAVSSSAEPDKVHNHFANAIAVLQSSSTLFNYKVIDYNPKLHTFNFERQLVLDLQEAMEQNHLFVVYQPKVDPKTNHINGLEALIRWVHPKYGFISPAQFIPILENSNKISDLTNWIIEQVTYQISEWNKESVPFQQVSINIPGSYITSQSLTNVLNECLLKYDIPARQIELEITETSVIHDIQNAIKAIRNFRDKGLSVALDDFGTGLSSLSYLKEIPITTIKIDKSFVDEVPNSRKDSSILKAIVELSYSLDLNVVIEGVETQEQVDYLCALNNVPVVQGYYYSKPLKVDEFNEWYKTMELETV